MSAYTTLTFSRTEAIERIVDDKIEHYIRKKKAKLKAELEELPNETIESVLDGILRPSLYNACVYTDYNNPED